ncbi:MAG TPA: double-strand break repair protein AddB, partial [Beijerinckiaceae bacterium]
LRRLLPTLGVQREAVRELGEPEPALAMRGRFVSEAMRPPETTDRWRAFREETPDDALRGALEGVSLVTAADEREEALALAVALREVLEDPEATAALVTPDRNLARRVRAELARWGVEIDDSGGEPLAGTPHGVLARLTLACAEPGCSAAPLLALLRHPLARLGLEAADLARRADLAELAVLRGARPDLTDPARAVAAARARLDGAHVHRALRALRDADWPLIEDLLARLETALAPLRALAADASVDAWVAAHERAVATLAAPATGEPAPDGEDTMAFAELMVDLRAARPAGFGLALRDYVVLFDVMAREKAVRGPRAAHPRIKSLGLLEARLIHADVVLLGGLDEAIWPPAARTDAFLNRPMRAELGLSPPERRIGQTAHDFTQALGAPRVILSRALKRGGAPTTPSRFLLRMETLAGSCWSDVRARGARLLDLARRLDAPASLTRIPRPAPTPDVELRPTSLSVTRIETLRRDPYSVYAERILKLSPLDGLDYEEGAREAGTRMHDMLARFQREFPSGPLPQGAAGRLVEIARETYAADLEDPAFRAFRWPRILTICQHFVGWDAERRESLAELVTEERGELDIPLSDGSVFKLTAVADRIERRPDGAIAVVDFKTGQPPSAAQVETGLAPQLTLEAKMIAAGAFGQLGSGAAIDQALYVKLGGRDSLTERNAVKKGATVQELMDEHYARLVELLEAFRRKEHPYLPRPYAQFVDVHTDYDHLSRYAEWSSGGGDA